MSLLKDAFVIHAANFFAPEEFVLQMLKPWLKQTIEFTSTTADSYVLRIYSHGILTSEVPFKDGKLHGLRIEWTDGIIIESINFINGIPNPTGLGWIDSGEETVVNKIKIK